MIYSKTCEYAIRSLTYLAKKPHDQWTRIPEVSKASHVPGPYVSKIFQHLVSAGVLKSCRGARGGFAFSKNPVTISVMDVIKAVDSLEPWNQCVMGLNRCQDLHGCAVHDIWKRAKEKMTQKLKHTKLTGLLKKKLVHYRELQRLRLNMSKEKVA